MPRVKLSNVTFRYKVFDLTSRSLKVAVMRQVAGAKLLLGNRHVEVQALSDISIDLKDGDRLGLVGHNGSGKSTLLRVIAGLAYPQQGDLQIEGRVLPLIDRGMGINAELSGYDNIELPLRLLGATDAEVKAAKANIPEWTGLGQFINLPFRTYSDGMKARLSFALSTAIPGDIIVLDEWLSAGDAAFTEQAEGRLLELLGRSKILVLASHALDQVRRICNVVAWMDRGRIVQMGPPEAVVPAYQKAMHAEGAAAE